MRYLMTYLNVLELQMTVIFGYNDHDHDQTLYTVLDRACKVGMKFNPDKCTFKRDSISFYGVTICADGVKPDPRKIDAIKIFQNQRQRHCYSCS